MLLTLAASARPFFTAWETNVISGQDKYPVAAKGASHVVTCSSGRSLPWSMYSIYGLDFLPFVV